MSAPWRKRVGMENGAGMIQCRLIRRGEEGYECQDVCIKYGVRWG